MGLSFSQRWLGGIEHKVTAGLNPADPATLSMRGNPDGSLSSGVGFAEALLSFRRGWD